VYFGLQIDVNKIRKSLMEAAEAAGSATLKVRLLFSENGTVSVKSEPLSHPATTRPWRLALSETRVSPDSLYLYHKTTIRSVYDEARKAWPGYDDVILLNVRDEITESTIANVAIEKNGKVFTPPVTCGLLAGVFRNWLIRRGELTERILTVGDILGADKLYLINSVRRWVPAELDRGTCGDQSG